MHLYFYVQFDPMKLMVIFCQIETCDPELDPSNNCYVIRGGVSVALAAFHRQLDCRSVLDPVHGRHAATAEATHRAEHRISPHPDR